LIFDFISINKYLPHQLTVTGQAGEPERKMVGTERGLRWRWRWWRKKSGKREREADR
jgi:hypothetical protein